MEPKEVKMEKENTSLATELIRELKSTSKRWFIAFIVVLSLWFATIGGFIIYLSLPIEETVTDKMLMITVTIIILEVIIMSARQTVTKTKTISRRGKRRKPARKGKRK